MASDPPRRRGTGPPARIAAALLFAAAAVLPAATPASAASPSPAASPAPPPGPWWQPLSFAGTPVTAVVVSGPTLVAVTPSGARVSTDGGTTFSPAAPPSGTPSVRQPPATAATTTSGGQTWALRAGDGRVLHAAAGTPLQPDPGGPSLGACARAIAAPAALPGTVLAAGCDGRVWRRAPDGAWNVALLLLPQGVAGGGAPAVTALAAFDRPLTTAVYLGTDGYGVLLTEDGGVDWIRAGPGLPDRVLALAADASRSALYAGTDRGLYVHRLQAFPAPPHYAGAALLPRQLGAAAVTLAAAVAGALLLHVLLRVAGARRPE